MQVSTLNFQALRTAATGRWRALAAALLIVACLPATAQIVTQTPLSSGGGVPGNMLLVPSVEWPTIDSLANIDLVYDSTKEYVGYFDPVKCYKYNYSTTETSRYFYPVSAATAAHTCAQSNKEWSGNFLNWAVTQTIDPFRKALTGGYRVSDTTTETILEKARSDGNTSDGIFPDRRVPDSGDNNTMVTGATPANWDSFNSRIRQFGNRMRFSSTGDVGDTPTPYDPSTALNNGNRNTVFEVSVRVKVCVTGWLEDNCVGYPAALPTVYKPEGLIQKYAARMRFSAFGYLNDHTTERDGGVLRARQKFVGPTHINPATGLSMTSVDPDNPEWSATTGVLETNPDDDDATATSAGHTINNSGVINYINKFGQMTKKDHKSLDPVSELYYTALRYLRNAGNVPAYTSLTGSDDNKYELADGFPVITNWTDPYQYWCQNSAILGIGDVNTCNEKNLNGTTRTNSEPGTPAEVAGDSIDVNLWTQKVATLEGISIPTVFTGRENSAYMVGLAYWAHTQDIRPGTTGVNKNKQTVSTHWVDVREARVLQPKARNQYWLAAKYGGFTLPGTGTPITTDDYDSLTNTTPLAASLWHTNVETLSTGDLRPDNFYVASDADKMVDSLTRAFARIAGERVGSGASLAANSTRLDLDTRTFQAQFRNENYGQLNSYIVNPMDGSLSALPIWTVGTPIPDGPAPGDATPGIELTRANWESRQIWTQNPTLTTKFVPLRETNLSTTQKGTLTFPGMPTSGLKAITNAEFVDYLRGSVAQEESETNGALRTRLEPAAGWSPILGDVVNSTPVFVGKPSATLYSGATFTGATTYGTFVTNKAGRLGVLWVGANDGMLHAFNANNGKEIFAFVPNSAFGRGIAKLANPDYQHQYYVDGDMAIADAYDTGTAQWRTILVGTMGRGGPGIFALDITDPSTPNTATNTGIKFLWENDASSGGVYAELGKNIGKPVIAQIANGTWKVILGNGIDSSAAGARLLVIDLFTGAALAKDVGVTGGNGLSAVLARDTNADGFADTAYAGDLKGNMWKFTGANMVGTSTKMFTAIGPTSVAQPITAAPLVGKDPVTGETWVFFGTGRYLNTTDTVSTPLTPKQSWYGIKDNGTTGFLRSTLVARTMLTTVIVPAIPPTMDFSSVRTVSAGTAADLVGKQGWYFDLPADGERIVVPNRFQGGALIGTTRIPTLVDVCQPTGKGFILAINPFTGGRLDQTFFDTNHDGVFNGADTLSGTIISGIGLDSSANNPIFVENVMQVGLDDGTTKTVRTQGTNVDASRLSWREILN
jgi:type IV pilus assembly protein PilY1